jgi:hypothetical protein
MELFHNIEYRRMPKQEINYCAQGACPRSATGKHTWASDDALTQGPYPNIGWVYNHYCTNCGCYYYDWPLDPGAPMPNMSAGTRTNRKRKSTKRRKQTCRRR